MQALEAKPVRLSNVCAYLLSLPSFIDCGENDTNPALLCQDRVEFEKAMNMGRVFQILSKYCSFLNCDILKDLIKVFQLELDEESSKYPDELRKYAEKHKICEFAEVIPLPERVEDKKEVILLLDIEATSKLSKVLDIREELAEIFGIDRSALLIHDVKVHCVHVVFLLPTAIADILFPDNVKAIFDAKQRRSFRRLSVRSLKCNGVEIFLTSQNAEPDSQARDKLSSILELKTEDKSDIPRDTAGSEVRKINTMQSTSRFGNVNPIPFWGTARSPERLHLPEGHLPTRFVIIVAFC
jgi:hypothetical protein